MTQAFNLSQFANKVNTSGQADLTTAVTGTLPVANGGTGATSITANGVVIGNGTSAVTTVAPSTSGNVLTSNGTSWVSSAPSGGSSGGQVFTSSGTFTIPSGVTAVKVTVIGAGGGGGSSSSAGGSFVSGAGGGGTAIKYLTGLTSGATLAVTVGTSTGASSSVSSGTQSISTITATGGAQGIASGTGGTGLGGTGSGGNLNIQGGSGTTASSGGELSTGGGSILSTRAPVGTTVNAPATSPAGIGFGQGSAGTKNGSTTIARTMSGGAGGAGVVIFEW